MNRKLSDSINNAVDGLIYAFKTERNLKIQAALMVAILTLCIFLDLTSIELLFVFTAITLVLFAELINTSVETLVNLLTLSHHPLARIVKDVAAGSVLIACANAAAVGYLVIVPALKRPMFLGVFEKIRAHQTHGVVMLVVIILVAVLVGKALGGTGSFTRGGLVSGHAALAFGASTAILLVSKNLLATMLAFMLAVLVAQSRIEANFHRWAEVAAGALIGIVSSLMVFELFYKMRGP